VLPDNKPSIDRTARTGQILASLPFAATALGTVPERASSAGCGDIRDGFATAFRNWRLKNNIPLKKIARDLGLSIATINSWESGTRFPTGYNLEMLANYTSVPPCRLLCVMADKCVPAACPLAMPKNKR
jgi:hypothetical protein